MNNNTVETLIGAVVVFVATAFLFFAYTSTNSGGISGYDVRARFASVDGISVGTDVRMHGIKIGTVSALSLDPKSYMAIAHLSIRNGIELPDDSSIKITSAGILGNSYVALSPGGSDTMIKSGGEIHDTQGAVDIMGLVGRYINGGGNSSTPPAGQQPPAPAPAPATTPAPAPTK